MNNRSFKGFTITGLYDSALITHLAGELFEIPLDDLLPQVYRTYKDDRISQYISEARGIIFYVVHYELLISVTGVGFMFKRNHTTVSYWLRKINTLALLTKRADRLRRRYQDCPTRPDLWPIVYRMLYPQQLEFC